MEIPRSVKAVVAGTLPVTSFKTEQERLDAFCSVMTISAQAGKNGVDGIGLIGEKGDNGADGASAGKKVKTVTVPDSVSSVDCDVSVEEAVVNIVSSSGSPTVGIKGVNGTTVYLTGSSGTGNNLKIKVINFTS